MDAGLLRGLYTLFMFVVFIGIVWWAWSSRRKSDFDEAASLPLDDDGRPAAKQQRNFSESKQASKS